MNRKCTNVFDMTLRGTHLQYFTTVRHALVVDARLIHPQGDAVQQNHHHTDSLEPRVTLSIKERMEST